MPVDIAHDAARVVTIRNDRPGVDTTGNFLCGRTAAVRNKADDAADILIAVYVDITAAITDTARRAVQLAHNTASAIAAVAGTGNLYLALHSDIFDGAAVHIAEQAPVCLAAPGDGQVGDGVALPIEAALEIVGGVVGAALSDRCPTLIAQVNVIAEHGAELFICVFSRCALIYLLRQPGQFTSLCDLVHTVFQRRFFNIVRTLPRDLFLQWDGHRLIPRLGHFGQIDSVALLGVIRTLKRPIVFVAHGQLVCAVLVGPHFPLPGRDGQFSLVRVLKCHRHHRLGGQ